MSHQQIAAPLALPARLRAGIPDEFSRANAGSTETGETTAALRNLWVEHVFWIRRHELAVNARDDTHRRLAEIAVIANAAAIARTISPKYGAATADRLRTSLAGHLTAVRHFNTAMRTRSKPRREQARRHLASNAREIAALLRDANPYLAEDAIIGFLVAHDARQAASTEPIPVADATRRTNEVPAALDAVRDPGWIIVAGMAIFFAVAAAVIAVT